MKKITSLPYAAFDFDGTLADSNGAYIKFCVDCFAEAGKQISWDFLERAKAMSLTDFCEDLSRELNCGWSKAAIEARLFAFTTDFYSNKVTLKTGVRQFLMQLRRNGVHMCILSSTSERFIRMALSHLEMEDWFEYVVTPEQVGGRAKRFPDIFLLACHQFGDPPMAQIAMYDDSLEALQTARSAGMTVVGVYDKASEDTADAIQALCDGYVKDFNELFAALK